MSFPGADGNRTEIELRHGLRPGPFPSRSASPNTRSACHQGGPSGLSRAAEFRVTDMSRCPNHAHIPCGIVGAPLVGAPNAALTGRTGTTGQPQGLPLRLAGPQVMLDSFGYVRSGKTDVAGKSILLFDDLIESGSTLRRVASVLLDNCEAASVYPLVLTRTR